MTTPAQDAPLVFPSVAFRPLRLLAICSALTALAVGLAAMAGHVMFGVFFGTVADTLRELVGADWTPAVDASWRAMLRG